MIRRTYLSAAALLTGVMSLGNAGAAGEPAAARGDAKVYVLNFNPAPQASNLVRDPCQAIDSGCRINVVKDTVMTVTASAEAQAKVADLLRQVDVPPRSQTFHIMILEAGMEPFPRTELPERVARALDQSSRLLPYKGYRLLEQGLLTTTERGKIALGDPENGFEAQLRVEGGADPASPLLVRSFEMTRAKFEQVGDQQFRRTVIETSFTIDPGQTVVLGASHFEGGDQALVVLVTAVPSA